MANALRMPKLGQEMTEGRVAEWLKSVGDEISPGELVALIETDKTTVDLESPVGGYVGAFTVDAGETVDVGAVIAWVLDRPDEPVPAAADVAQPGHVDDGPPAVPPEDEMTHSLSVGFGSQALPTTPVARRPADRRIPASPLARRRAEQLGVDLAGVTPTGPQGWVTVGDIEAANTATASREQNSTVPGLTPMRKAIATQMTRSALIPQFRVAREVDLTEVAAHLEGQPSTLTDAVVWAVGRALTLHPDVNSSWVDGPPPAVVRHSRIVVGLAVAFGAGLIVPVIADADRLSLAELHERRVLLETAARNGTLSSSQLEGATFTVSNLGSLGVDQFDALVNPPEAGILAVGAARDRPVVVDAAIVVRKTTMLTFAGDHRVIDGSAGARFLETVTTLLAPPVGENGRS